MEMNMLPAIVDALPDSRLFDRDGHWAAVSVQALDKPHVGNYGGIVPHHAHMGRSKRRVAKAGRSFEVEIELVKVETFDKLAEAFRFKARERHVTQLDVSVPVLVANRIQKLLRQLNQLRFGRGHGVRILS